jgi:type II secretory pathway component PulF
MKKPATGEPKQALSTSSRGAFREERQQIFESFSMLLSSGTDVLTAFNVIREEIENSRMAKILDRMGEEIESGGKLSQVLRNSGLIDDREFALLKIGEESGRISQNIDLISKQEIRDREFRSRIKSATLYPIIVLSIALVLGITISWFILPKLSGVFSSLHLELPLATRIVVAFGAFLQKYGIIAVPVFTIVLSSTFYFTFFFKTTRHVGEWILMHSPGIKDLIQESEVSRFGYLFGTLLSAGIPIENAIASVEEATEIRAYKRLYRHLGEKIIEGYALGEVFRSYPNSGTLIPLSAQHMISAGAESGKLSEALLSVGERYTAKAEFSTKNLGTMLEPVMIVVIWLAVVFIAFAVISPIYGLLQGVR